MNHRGLLKLFNNLWLLVLFWIGTWQARADRIGEIVDISLKDQFIRFVSMEDPALRFALAGGVILGILYGMMGMIQHLPTGNKSGMDKFLFGQAAALGWEEIQIMALVGLIALSMIYLFYKELLVSSFDASFARSIRIPVDWIHHGFMLLLAFAIVISLEAVGVVLVSAMLIMPAATAFLLNDPMHWMLLWACMVGIIAGVGGVFFSFLGQKLPTGRFMVLSAAVPFASALFFAPRHGMLDRW